jgi:hypothetical protein
MRGIGDFSRWEINEKTLASLFMVQLIDEMCAHSSKDIYKPRCTTSSVLCEELKYQLRRHHDDKANLIKTVTPIVEELIDSLQDDPVAKSLLGIRYEFMISEIERARNSLDELSLVIESLNQQLSYDRYLHECGIQLKQLLSDPKRKREIATLTRIWMTQILNVGYSQSHVYHSVDRGFFRTSILIRNSFQAEKFIDDFIGIPRMYTVYAWVHKDFAKFEPVVEGLSFPNVEDFQPQLDPGKAFLKRGEQLQDYCLLKVEISALDRFQAWDKVQDTLKALANTWGVYSHGSQPNWDPESLVCHRVGKKLLEEKTKEDVSTILAGPNHSAETVLVRGLQILQGHNLKADAKHQLDKVIELHGLAMNAQSPKNQLLNLWSAIESMFPMNGTKKESRIEHLLRNLTPILLVSHPLKVFDGLYRDVKKVLEQTKDFTLPDLGSEMDELLRFTAMIVVPSMKEYRQQLYNACANNPLLCNRIYRIYEDYSDARTIKRNIERLERKIGWHVRRMYRARNEIIHSGSTQLSFIKILVSHLHSYVDTVLGRLQYVITRYDRPYSFDDLVYESSVEHRLHMKLLDDLISNGSDIDEHNFAQIIFGDTYCNGIGAQSL